VEDHREDLVVVLAGYTDDMDALIASNIGMATRFPTTIIFEDYTGPEMMQIALKMLGEKSLCLAPDAVQPLQARLARLAALQQTPEGRAAGNARGVRNIIEATVRAQSTRLHPIVETATVTLEQLETIAAGDVAS